jgi:GT2 family glycosyltransferase
VSTPRIAAAVVTMNKRDAVLALLARLRDDGIPATVTTNACSDGTPDAVRAAFPEVTVLESAVNLGGTGGFNCAVLHALETGAAYVALIDDDALPEPGCLAELADFLDGHADHAFAAPAIHIASRPELLQECGGGVDWSREVAVEAWHRFWKNEGLPERIDVGYASACTLLVRADRIRAVGVMDWDFFLFYDDVDWTLRLRGSDWKGACIPSVRALHDFPWAKPLALSRLYYFHRNGLRLAARWRPETDRTLRALRLPLLRLVRDWIHCFGHGDTAVRRTLGAALRDACTGRFGPWPHPEPFPGTLPRVDRFDAARVLLHVHDENLIPAMVAGVRAACGPAVAIDVVGAPHRIDALVALGVFERVFGRDLRRSRVPAQIAALRARGYDAVVTDTSIEPRNWFDTVGRASLFHHDGVLYAAPHRPRVARTLDYLAATLGAIAAWPLAWWMRRGSEQSAPPDAARSLLAQHAIGSGRPGAGDTGGRRC